MREYLCMEEIEIPTEHLQEKIQETAEEKSREQRWTLYVALSTAFVAVLAAIAGLLAGHHSNEAVIDQIRAGDQWAFYQSKSIKQEIAASENKILQAIPGAKMQAEGEQNVNRYEKEKEGIKAGAEESEKSASAHLERHVVFAKSVTIFQIAIAIAAIAILTKKKVLWYAGLVLSAFGTWFLVTGLL